MQYNIIRLKNGAERFTGVFTSRERGVLTFHYCDHKHKYYDLALTCSRRLEKNYSRTH